eukprot:TRINITY_DN20663_c1_g1_i1.p1 TRINITY_DN20663_c1_g1~~TRINITY_DN20663_c1_g1_i1.p1  ORF type:complete len:830 (+),score=110.85 TRINITY_DN20663_c1_g1_i1:186-2675(+)
MEKASRLDRRRVQPRISKPDTAMGLEELCTAIGELVAHVDGTSIMEREQERLRMGASVDPAVVQLRAKQLLSLSEAMEASQLAAVGVAASPEVIVNASVLGDQSSGAEKPANVGRWKGSRSVPQSSSAMAESDSAAVSSSLIRRGRIESDSERESEHSTAAAADASLPGSAAAPTTNRRGLWADHPALADRQVGGMWTKAGSAILVVLLTAPYYVCVCYTSWFVDEGFAIYRNPDAMGQTPVMEVLRHDFWGTHLNPPEGYNTHKSYRPIITLSFAAEWLLAARMGFAGQEMKPMRFLCCVVHTMNSLLTLRLLQYLRLPATWAFLGAALFAAHPVHIENIVYIVGRADSLSTTFSLLAILFYLGVTLRPRPKLSVLSYACLAFLTAAAGLCKETGFTVIFFLACAEVILRSRWVHVFGLVLSFVTIGGLRTWYVGGTEAGFGYVDTPIRYQDARLTRTLSYLYQHAYHVKLLVLPWNQSWDYSYDALPMLHSFFDVRIIAILTSYLSVAALASYGLRSRARSPVVVLGVGLVVIPFIPASNLFFLVGTTVAERLLYPCTVGWSVLMAQLGAQSRSKRQFSAAAVALLFVYVYNSNVRMSHWRSTEDLFLQDGKHWSRSSKVLHSVASELQGKGDLHGALDNYLKSLEVFDDTAITDYCIARIQINLGRYQEALERFNKILTGHGIGLHDGNDFMWMTDLGYLLVRLGDFDQGIHYLEDGLKRMAWSCYGWNAVGVAYAHKGDLAKASEALLTALECDKSSAITWSNLGVINAYRGNMVAETRECVQNSLALNASDPVVVHNAQVLMGQFSHDRAQPSLGLYIPNPGRR